MKSHLEDWLVLMDNATKEVPCPQAVQDIQPVTGFGLLTQAWIERSDNVKHAILYNNIDTLMSTVQYYLASVCVSLFSLWTCLTRVLSTHHVSGTSLLP